MNETNFQEFKKGIVLLGELHNRSLTPAMVMLYFKTLKEFDLGSVMNAMSIAAKTLKFFPKPAELIELIQGRTEDKAEIELAKVMGAIRRHGAYTTIVFDDPVTVATIRQGFGGWTKLCDDLLEKDGAWFRRDFLRIWQAFHAQGVKEYGKLLGHIEADNSAAGYQLEIKPVFIGDIQKAIEILEWNEPKPDAKILKLVNTVCGEFDRRKETA